VENNDFYHFWPHFRFEFASMMHPQTSFLNVLGSWLILINTWWNGWSRLKKNKKSRVCNLRVNYAVMVHDFFKKFTCNDQPAQGPSSVGSALSCQPMDPGLNPWPGLCWTACSSCATSSLHHIVCGLWLSWLAFPVQK
jgi:hypothetical protein